MGHWRIEERENGGACRPVRKKDSGKGEQWGAVGRWEGRIVVREDSW